MVAITGATGLLGGHIIERFQQEGIKVIGLHRNDSDVLQEGVIRKKGDVLDQVSLREAFEGVTTVIHAAAFVSFNPRWKKKIFDVNIEGTKNVIDTCLQVGVKNVIHISSVAAVGRKSGEVMTEESKWIGDNTSYYAESKYQAELEVFRGGEEGLNVCMVNPSVILSTSQPGRSSATIFDYVWNEKPYYTKGALNYVDARDVAEAVFQLYKSPQPGERFLLSAGSVPFRDFFSRVAQRFGKKAPSILMSGTLSYWAGWAEEMRAFIFNREPIVTRQSAKMAVQSFQYDTSKIQNRIGLKFRPLEDSLQWCCGDFLLNVKANK